MNQAELDALISPISNESRVLYMLGLRPGADKTTGVSAPLNYRNLLALLNSKATTFALGRQINQLLKELADAGLIICQQESISDRSLNGESLLLPLLVPSSQGYQQLHLQWQAMTADWMPDEALFSELATLVGLLDKNYQQQDVGEFVAYWLSRPEINLTLFQWTQKFVLHLKNRRQAYGQKQQVGHQVVTSTAGITADDNARKLVEKYHAKPKR
ncbi:DnaT-like ssDNA-binding domain-containing protein [Lacimicrobium alkaliphilum]|uniref:Flavodoxin n=1 Tax=Lacimicrobium alkaliphilum TaxID=1526571 RepID=A0A0U3B9D1_9ALTE|nr:DnaT-like ssDNA-binding domain-containing protein [Lacimicrobium alkaliphilum]ALT00154.1 flavodoxin [Lacimicrobium alkaliphilum]